MDSGKTLYEVLGVGTTATQAEIRRAYHGLSLKSHPDKNHGDAEATHKFQSLQRIYSILSDDHKRRIYDATGRTDDESLSAVDMPSLFDYFKGVRLASQDIDAFARTYRGSPAEAVDVLAAYTRYSGDMVRLFWWVMLSEPVDSHRFMDIIEEAIVAGQVQRFPAFSEWAQQTAANPRPTKTLQQRAALSDAQAEAAVHKALRAAAARTIESTVAKLERTVAAKGTKSGQAYQAFKEPTEEEWAAAQARMSQRCLDSKVGGRKSRSKALASRSNQSSSSDEEDADVKVVPERARHAVKATKLKGARVTGTGLGKENVGAAGVVGPRAARQRTKKSSQQ